MFLLSLLVLLCQSLNKQKNSSYFISLPGTAVTKEQKKKKRERGRKKESKHVGVGVEAVTRRFHSGEVGWEQGSPLGPSPRRRDLVFLAIFSCVASSMLSRATKKHMRN